VLLLNNTHMLASGVLLYLAKAKSSKDGGNYEEKTEGGG
jgi:hypothetical protein